MNAIETKSETESGYFDKAYQSNFVHWFWGDIRIPAELKAMVEKYHPKTSLELGCGLGRFSAYLAEQGIQATGIDFSKVAVEKANHRLEGKARKPTFLVGDVTNLEILHEPFDVAFDIGCFHCLKEFGQQKYAQETSRLLKPGSPLLIWALDSSPSDIKLGPDDIAKVFSKGFQLVSSKFTRRRIIASHRYWLERTADR
jgi:SAM-dependent methyltransferase